MAKAPLQPAQLMIGGADGVWSYHRALAGDCVGYEISETHKTNGRRYRFACGWCNNCIAFGTGLDAAGMTLYQRSVLLAVGDLPLATTGEILSRARLYVTRDNERGIDKGSLSRCLPEYLAGNGLVHAEIQGRGIWVWRKTEAGGLALAKIKQFQPTIPVVATPNLFSDNA